jgi:uncharacterized protein HemY
LEEVAVELEKIADGTLPAGLVRARGFLRRREFNATRGVLAELIEQFPRSIEARQLLSHAYLQEGQDWQAAQDALEAILKLDPEHREAAQNLSVLLRQRAS